jgi:hypothetical protein
MINLFNFLNEEYPDNTTISILEFIKQAVNFLFRGEQK